MTSHESSHQVNEPTEPIIYRGGDAVRFVIEKAGESLSREGHGHRRVEAIRDSRPPGGAESLDRGAAGHDLHDEILDVAFGDGTSDQVSRYLH